MRLPVDWLKEYVPNELSMKELAFLLTNVGLEVEAIEGTGDAPVFDIKVTPNRGDCLSARGVARELAMKLCVDLKTRRPSIEETDLPASSLVKITLDDPELCPRYSARILKKIRIGPSPTWAQRRLELCGLRPINNVVDATNLVMMELGQPLHAFDYRLLRKEAGTETPEIIVRTARPGERLVTIDGEERELPTGVLLITDPIGPIALAGIMGGASSEIHDGTTEVLLESAHFDPGIIRRGARALRMSTEASHRFERTVDPGGTIEALDRACELIVEFSAEPVEVAAGVVDAYPEPVKENVIELRPERANALLNLELTPEEMAEALRRLYLKVNIKEDKLLVEAPTFRQDLKKEIDLVEEVARVHGYEDIPETLPAASAVVGGLPPELALEHQIRSLLHGMGLSETVTSSLESPEVHDHLKLSQEDPRREAVRIVNWKTEDRTQLRTTLLSSLLDVVALNRRHGIEEVAIYDMGRVYQPIKGENLPEQPQRLGIAVTGNMTQGKWAMSRELASWDFYALKGVIENLLEFATGERGEYIADALPPFRPGRTAQVLIKGERMGMIGEALVEVREAYDLPQSVYLAELDLDKLRGHLSDAPQFKELSRYPAVRRDVAFLVDREITAGKAKEKIRESGGESVEEVALFDAFEGRPIPKGKKNLAFSLVFRRLDRTMTDDEVDEVLERVRQALTEELGAEIRQ